MSIYIALYYPEATTTTTRSCRDPETAVIHFCSPGGVRHRPQRAGSAAADDDASATAAAAAAAAADVAAAV